MHQKRYRCYHPPTRRLFITMDVVFHEDTMYFSESEFQGEYWKEIQTLNYGENNQEVVNLDLSSTLDQSGDSIQIGQNQEMSELDSSGTLDQSSDDHPIIEDVGLSPTQPETEILENMAHPPSDIPHQSLAEDVPETHKR